MVINVLSQVLNNNLVPDYVRSNLRGSKFKFYVHYYHPATTMFPPQLKILYETQGLIVNYVRGNWLQP